MPENTAFSLSGDTVSVNPSPVSYTVPAECQHPKAPHTGKNLPKYPRPALPDGVNRRGELYESYPARHGFILLLNRKPNPSPNYPSKPLFFVYAA
ncbi:MAG: hypothetical protein IJV91_08315, partial [Kiritimatiellae bacterium]|nr:hypothetical protein [Kiritimatiellia bacterium]